MMLVGKQAIVGNSSRLQRMMFYLPFMYTQFLVNNVFSVSVSSTKNNGRSY